MEIFKLFGSILIDNDEANKSISKTGKESEGLASKMGRGIKTAGKWALGITTAAIGIGAAAFAMTKKVTGAFDDIAKNSRKMGVSTDYYQEMEYWASQNGLSHENMEKSMKRLNQRLGQAVEGNEKYSNALTRLGVDLEEVEKGNVSTEQAMTQSIQALSQMENSQEKAALASELFGTKLAQELMPAIDSGALSIEDAQKKAEELGIVIAEDTLNAAEEFNDTWDDLTRMMSAFGQKIFAELMPAFQIMMDWVLEHMPAIQNIAGTAFSVIGTALRKIGEVISDYVIPMFIEFWEWLSPHLPMIKELAVEVFGITKDAISDLIDAIKDITTWFQKHWSVIEPIFIGIAAGVVAFEVITLAIKLWTIATTIATTVTGAFGAVLAFITSPIGLVVVAIGALIAIGVALYKNWDKVSAFGKRAWSAIKSTISNTITSIAGFFKDLPGEAKDWGMNMIKGFVDGIKNMGKAVADAASGVVKKAAGFLKFWSPAKEGEGRFITDWGENMVDGFLDGVRNESSEAGKVMNDLIESMSPKALSYSANLAANNGAMTITSNPSETLSNDDAIQLLKRIAIGIESGHSIQIDGKEVAKQTSNSMDDELGKRVLMSNRRVEI